MAGLRRFPRHTYDAHASHNVGRDEIEALEKGRQGAGNALVRTHIVVHAGGTAEQQLDAGLRREKGAGGGARGWAQDDYTRGTEPQPVGSLSAPPPLSFHSQRAPAASQATRLAGPACSIRHQRLNQDRCPPNEPPNACHPRDGRTGPRRATQRHQRCSPCSTCRARGRRGWQLPSSASAVVGW